MPDFERGTIVRVPFPYTDRETRQHRPALIVSDGALGPEGGLLWVVMITSAANRRWDGDVQLTEDFESCGLPAPSLIRTAKIATIDTSAAQRLGTLDSARLSLVAERIAHTLSIG